MRTTVAIWAEPTSPIFFSWVRQLLRGHRHEWCRSQSAVAELLSGDAPPSLLLVHLEVITEEHLGWLSELSRRRIGFSVVALGVRAQQCPLSFRIGARGFILIGDPPDLARSRMQSAARGEMTLCRRSVQALQDHFDQHHMDVDMLARTLSTREREALRWLCQGEPLTRVARRMGVSYHTATTFVRRMYEKVGVRSHVALTRFGFQAGLDRQRDPRSDRLPEVPDKRP